LGKKILHATLGLGDQPLTGADVPPEWYKKPQGFFVSLNVDLAAEAERIFEESAVRFSILRINHYMNTSHHKTLLPGVGMRLLLETVLSEKHEQ
jgi:hypothetical protein